MTPWQPERVSNALAGLLELMLLSLGWFLCIFVFLFLALLFCGVFLLFSSIFPQGIAAYRYYSLCQVCTQDLFVFLVALILLTLLFHYLSLICLQGSGSNFFSLWQLERVSNALAGLRVLRLPSLCGFLYFSVPCPCVVPQGMAAYYSSIFHYPRFVLIVLFSQFT